MMDEVIPVGTYFQDFVVIDKDMNGKITEREALGVVIIKRNLSIQTLSTI